MKFSVSSYIEQHNQVMKSLDVPEIERAVELIREKSLAEKKVAVCGNGGSAGNAIHLANDFIYGIDKKNGVGLKVEALTSNASILTCLANDEGYETIFSQQLKVKANRDDVLIVLSGSGNSQNVVRALEVGNKIGMKTFAITGFFPSTISSISLEHKLNNFLYFDFFFKERISFKS